MGESNDNADSLNFIRDQITEYFRKNEEENKEIPDDLRTILLSVTILADIVDNHEARLRLSERCFNSVKQTYQFYDLDK